jgi:GTP cyclohydrolase IA
MTVQDHQVGAHGIDTARIETAMQDILRAINLDQTQEGLRETPQRVARMYEEVFSGLDDDPLVALQTGFEEGYDEMVVARDIPFFSMCEHHFLPFYGVAHIGYIPQGRIVGISKLARVTEILARRPQVQERLTAQIADTVVAGTNPMGAAVVVEAEHLCMVMRGVKKPGSKIVTSVNRGVFRTDPRTRAEFLSFTRANG